MSADDRDVQTRLERASLYRLLGASLSCPAPDQLEALAEVAERLAPVADPRLADPLGRFAAAVRATDAATVADEYVFLFDREARCPPYEGAWGDAQLAGKAALLADIAGFYAAFGLQPAAARPDVEDHIAAECEFLSALALKEAYALAEGDEEGAEIVGAAQSRFVADHLGRWSETFCAALRETSPVPYYGALADLLGAWVRAEVERLGVAPALVAGSAIQEAEAFTCPMAEPEALAEEPGAPS